MENSKSFNPYNLKKDDWNHSAHILTAAYFCLNEESFYSALTKTKCFIIHFGAERGFSSEQCSAKYHETMTCFWVKLIYDYINEKNITNIDEFESNIKENPAALDKNIIYKHYSKETLESEESRALWLKSN